MELFMINTGFYDKCVISPPVRAMQLHAVATLQTISTALRTVYPRIPSRLSR